MLATGRYQAVCSVPKMTEIGSQVPDSRPDDVGTSEPRRVSSGDLVTGTGWASSDGWGFVPPSKSLVRMPRRHYAERTVGGGVIGNTQGSGPCIRGSSPLPRADGLAEASAGPDGTTRPPWSSGLGRRPLKADAAGSNPAGGAIGHGRGFR